MIDSVSTLPDHGIVAPGQLDGPNTGHRIECKRVVLFGSHPHSLVHFRGPLIEELIRRGHQVFAIASEIDEGTAATLRSYGATPVSVKFGRTSLNPREALRMRRRLTEVLRAIRPDLMLTYTIKPILIGVPAARKAGAKRIVTLVTGLGYAFTGGRELKRVVSRIAATILYRRALALSDLVVFQNENDRADFSRLGILPHGAKTGLVNGSGVDVDHFSASPPPGEASFLMIARLLGDKGLREYAKAAQRLKQMYPQVRVSLIGAIDTEPNAITPEELNTFIDWGIDYLGPQSDVRPFIADHSVYVLPSYREGTPRSVLEALAVGRAVITTDAPGCRQTVDPGKNGLLVPPRDVDELFKAMLHLVENPHLIENMGRASRIKAVERYDVRKVNESLLALACL